MSTTDPTSHRINRNWTTLIGALAVVILALAALFALRSGETDPSANGTEQTAAVASVFADGSGPLQVGDTAWAFQLSDVDGNAVALDELSGRPIVINFWASWCGPCRIEFPHLQEAADSYGDDVVFLAVNQQEDAETVVDYFVELGLSLPVVLDSDGTVAQQYAVGRTLPTTFFIGETGEVSAVHRGPMTLGQIEGYIADTVSQ